MSESKTINITTKSEEKIGYLKQFLDLQGVESHIETVNIETERVKQPTSEDLLVDYCQMAAKAAYEKGGADWGMAMEGGLVLILDRIYLVCVVCLFNGKRQYLGISSKLALPFEVSNEVRSGSEFGPLIEKFAKDNEKNDEKSDLANTLISRREAFLQSLANIWLAMRSDQ